MDANSFTPGGLDGPVEAVDVGLGGLDIAIRFGPLDHQTMSPELASMLLTLWRERAPATFGSYLGEVLTGERPADLPRRRGNHHV